MDHTILLKGDHDHILTKRAVRDEIERGMSPEQIKYQWHNHVVPGYKKFIEPYEQDAHLAVHNNLEDEEMLESVLDNLKTFVLRETLD